MNIAAGNPGSRVAAKANVIVVQKGQARGVTLSHAGKVIIESVKVTFSNRQTLNSIYRKYWAKLL